MTLLLSRTDLLELLDIESCIDVLTQGFRADPSTVQAQRVRTDLTGPGTATTLIPGLLDDVPAYTVKVNAKFPQARPALRGIVCLHDLATGELLTLLDSATVTAWRTGLSAAIATDIFARDHAPTIGVVGAGAQADIVLRGLKSLRSWENLRVYDLDARRGVDFAQRHEGESTDLRSAVRDADIAVLATWSRTPLLDEGDVAPGTHITSLGADEPGKRELSTGLLESGRVFVDDVSLAVEMGTLDSAVGAAGTLGQVLNKTIPGRRADDELTVYSPVGLPWQDLALAWMAYRKALTENSGRQFEFLD